MNLNPFHYLLKRYHSQDLKPSELKRMLNLWFPFFVNRIRIISISYDFYEILHSKLHWGRDNRSQNKEGKQ